MRRRKRRYKRNRASLFEILWERKFFYPFGFLVGICCGLLNTLLGQDIPLDELIFIAIATSFFFGYIIHSLIKDGEKVREEGRYYFICKEGFVHFALTFLIIVCYASLRLINK